MTDREKFAGFKKEAIEKNETKYGKEIREKYGEETVEASNAKYMNMSREEFQKMNQIEGEMIRLLADVTKSKELDSKEAQSVYSLGISILLRHIKGQPRCMQRMNDLPLIMMERLVTVQHKHYMILQKSMQNKSDKVKVTVKGTFCHKIGLLWGF